MFLVLTFPEYNLEFLAWVAWIPLFFAMENTTPQRAALFGFVTGMVFYNWGLGWINNTLINYGNLHWAFSFSVLGLLSAYLSLFISLFCYFVRRTCGENRIRFFLFAPVLWVSLENLRSSNSEYGFSWLGLGYSQFQNLPVIQLAEWTGVYGVSWLILLVNSGLYLSWKCWREQKQKECELKIGWRILSTTLIVCAFWLVYGSQSLKKYSNINSEKIRIGLVQGNVEQFMKWNPAYQNLVINKFF